jgi:hypothetical protein
MKIKNFKDFKGSRKTFYLSRSSKNSIDSFNGIHLCTDSILEESESNRIDTLKRYAKNIFKAFKSEAGETGDMIQVFNRKLRSKLNLKNREGDPSPEEMKEALTQLKNIPKLAPYAIILLTSPIPFSSSMYAGLSFYLKKVSNGKINLLPSSFGEVFDDSDEER